jgi:hypothetical protein
MKFKHSIINLHKVYLVHGSWMIVHGNKNYPPFVNINTDL